VSAAVEISTLLLPIADPRAELEDIRAQGLRGNEIIAVATARLVTYTRDGRWRKLPEGYRSIAAFLTAEFPLMADLQIPEGPRRELVALMATEKVPQKAIAGALGVNQATVSRDRGIMHMHNSSPDKRGPGRPRSTPSGNGSGPVEPAVKATLKPLTGGWEEFTAPDPAAPEPAATPAPASDHGKVNGTPAPAPVLPQPAITPAPPMVVTKMPAYATDWAEVNRQFADRAEAKLGEQHRAEVA